MSESNSDISDSKIWKYDNDADPLYEWGLWRYIPGLTKHWYPRYCLITKSGFFYFENKQKSINNNTKPLADISLREIQSAQCVKVMIPEEKQIKSQIAKQSFKYEPTSIFPQFQFEIFLKNNVVIENHNNNRFNRKRYSELNQNIKLIQKKDTDNLYLTRSQSKENSICNDKKIDNIYTSKITIPNTQVLLFINLESFNERTF